MGDYSDIEFRSNIYPVSTVSDLSLDREFRESITDPFALSILWSHNGSNGGLLSEMQKLQYKKADPCVLGDRDRQPWGTKTINGHSELVCLCEKRSCELYTECMQRHPEAVASSTAANSMPKEVKRADGLRHESELGFANTRKRLGVELRSTVSSPMVECSTEWTAEEDARLKEKFNQYPREMLYILFPDKEVADIEVRIRKVCFSFVKREQTDTIRPSREKEQVNVPSQRPIVQVNRKEEEKSRRLAELHSKPWHSSEDEIIRRNYPKYGTTLVLWDKQLYGRKLNAIVERAKQLGLRFDGATNLSKKSPSSAGTGRKKQKRSNPNNRVAESSHVEAQSTRRNKRSNGNKKNRRKGTAGTSRPWSPWEIQVLKGNYRLFVKAPQTLKSLLPGRSLREVKDEARKLGLG